MATVDATVNGVVTTAIEATVTQADPAVTTTVLTDAVNPESVTATVDNTVNSVTATASKVAAETGTNNVVTRVAVGVTPAVSTVTENKDISVANLPKVLTTTVFPWDFRPTVKPDEKFDDGIAEQLGKQIRAAVKDPTQNVKYVYQVCTIIGSHTYTERKRIGELYKTQFGADMSVEVGRYLRKETRELALGLLSEPGYNDARCIKEAISGPVSFWSSLGTDEDTLIEILTSRTNAEIVALKNAYKSMYGKDVEEEIKQDTSGLFEDFLVALLNANRYELGIEEEPLTDLALADVAELFAATQGRYMGSDMFSSFNRILCMRSFAHINLVNIEYQKAHQVDLEQVIENQAAEHLRDGYMAIVKLAKSQAGYFAGLLSQNISSGAGRVSDQKQFMRILASRSEKDLGAIITYLSANHSLPMAGVIEKEISASYRQLLYALTGVTASFAL